MSTGVIARIVADRGFGFIKMEGSDKDLFFHATKFNGDFNSLKEGDAVSFDIEEGDKGQFATNISKA